MLALTPGILFNEVSKEFTQDEQVMPVTDKSICLVLLFSEVGRNCVNCVLMMSKDYSLILI